MNIKWTNLTNPQKEEIIYFYKKEMAQKDLFQHDLNRRAFKISSIDGRVVFGKNA